MAQHDGRFSTVIRASLRISFFKEKNKGQLINTLLEKHYSRIGIEPLHPVPPYAPPSMDAVTYTDPEVAA